MDSKIKEMYYKDMPMEKAKKLHLLACICNGSQALTFLVIIFGYIFAVCELAIASRVDAVLILFCVIAFTFSYIGLSKTDDEWMPCDTTTIAGKDFLEKAALYNACVEAIGNRQCIGLDELRAMLPEYAGTDIGIFKEWIEDLCDRRWFRCGEVIDETLCISESAVEKYTFVSVPKGKYYEQERELLEQNAFPETYADA